MRAKVSEAALGRSASSACFVAGAIIVIAWCDATSEKVKHYRRQAEIQAGLERLYRDEEKKVLTQLDGATISRMAADLASRHARLRDEYANLASHPWLRAPADLPLPYPWDRERDREVLETVLSGLLVPGTPLADMFAERAAAERTFVVVNAYITDIDAPAPVRDLGAPNGVPRGQLEESIRLRNAGGELPLEELGGKLARAVVLDINRFIEESTERDIEFADAFWGKYSHAWGYVGFSLPGYSCDGKYAIVRFVAGPAFHEQVITCIVVRKEKAWKVESREVHAGE